MAEQSTLDLINLGSADQAVYEAIVTHQPIAPDEIAVNSGVTGQRLRAALDRLGAKGLISQERGELGRIVASPPDIALGALLMEREGQLKRARREMDKLAALHLQTATAMAGHAGLVEFVSGRDDVLCRFEQLQRASSREVRIVDKPPYFARDPYGNVAEVSTTTRRTRRSLPHMSGLPPTSSIRPPTRSPRASRRRNVIPLKVSHTWPTRRRSLRCSNGSSNNEFGAPVKPPLR